MGLRKGSICPSEEGGADLSNPGAWEAVAWLDKKRGERHEVAKQPGLRASLSGEVVTAADSWSPPVAIAAEQHSPSSSCIALLTRPAVSICM